MNITFTLNNKAVSADIAPDTLLLDLVRRLGCKSVKRGCGTGNCGLCTVYLDGTPILSCATLAARVQGRSVTTLEGLQSEAAEFGAFLADQGAEQCGFCSRRKKSWQTRCCPGKRWEVSFSTGKSSSSCSRIRRKKWQQKKIPTGPSL